MGAAPGLVLVRVPVIRRGVSKGVGSDHQPLGDPLTPDLFPARLIRYAFLPPYGRVVDRYQDIGHGADFLGGVEGLH